MFIYEMEFHVFPPLLIFLIIRWYPGAPFLLVIGYLKYSTHTEKCMWECSQTVQIPGNVPRPAPGPEPFPVPACRRTTTLTLMPASELHVSRIAWPVPFGVWCHVLSLTLVTLVRAGAGGYACPLSLLRGILPCGSAP